MNFYTGLFEHSKVDDIARYDDAGAEVSGQAKGSVMSLDFQLAGQSFGAINGGPVFKFSPAVSFLVACETKDEVDALWVKLSEGGKIMMELGAYPFSERYGWTQDKYGLSWRVMFMGGNKVKQKLPQP